MAAHFVLVVRLEPRKRVPLVHLCSLINHRLSSLEVVGSSFAHFLPDFQHSSEEQDKEMLSRLALCNCEGAKPYTGDVQGNPALSRQC